MNKIEKHRKLCSELNELYAKKNKDYGDSFGITFQEEGYAMCRIRLSDKLNRFKSLTKSKIPTPLVKDESIRDTMIDLANYALMTIIEIDNAIEEVDNNIKEAQRVLSKVPYATPYNEIDGECL